jgi:hypothetical protein
MSNPSLGTGVFIGKTPLGERYKAVRIQFYGFNLLNPAYAFKQRVYFHAHFFPKSAYL